jgi:three-Cys-motif partner protein
VKLRARTATLSPKKPENGPDGLPAPEVGPWAEEKHRILKLYLDFHSHARRKWLKDPRQNGATYVDLFCAAGMARIEDTQRFIAGSALVAWNASVESGTPFSKVVIADLDPVLRAACGKRLRRAGAPVIELEGDATEAAKQLPSHLNRYGLHFAFLDPYSLGQLSFELIRIFAQYRHVDILAHVSAMDLFRNFRKELNGERSEFDDFAPNWRAAIWPGATDEEGRRAAIDYWKDLVIKTGLQAQPNLRQVKNSVNRDLYWLMLIASAELAGKFWDLVLQYDRPQSDFGF